MQAGQGRAGQGRAGRQAGRQVVRPPRTKIKTLVLCFLCTGSLFLAPKEALVAKDCFFSFLGSPPSASPRAAPPARPSAVAVAVTRAEDCPPLAAGSGGSGYGLVFKSPTTARSGPPCGGWIAPESGVPRSPVGDSPCVHAGTGPLLILT